MALPIFLKSTAALCVVTGAMDVFIGPNFALNSVGAPPWSPVNAVLGNQYRFFGGIWAGYGAMLWWVSDDIVARRTPLAILLGSLAFGGVGRLAAAAADGFGSSRLMMFFTGLEFVLPVVIGGLAGVGLRSGNSLA